MTLGDRIKKLRTRQGYKSVREFATACGLSMDRVTALESDKLKATALEAIIAVANTLRTPVGELLGEEGWIFIPRALHDIALSAGLTYSELTTLNVSWHQLSDLARENPDSLRVLLQHPQLAKAVIRLGNGATVGAAAENVTKDTK